MKKQLLADRKDPRTRCILVPESVSVNSGGALRATIFFRRDSLCLPADNWNDFALILLEWWLRGLLQVVRGARQDAKLEFMEGPYHVNVRGIPGGLATLEFVDEGRPHAKLPPPGKEKLLPIVDDMIGAADFVVEFAAKSNVEGRDLDRLRHTLAEARMEIGEKA